MTDLTDTIAMRLAKAARQLHDGRELQLADAANAIADGGLREAVGDIQSIVRPLDTAGQDRAWLVLRIQANEGAAKHALAALTGESGG